MTQDVALPSDVVAALNRHMLHPTNAEIARTAARRLMAHDQWQASAGIWRRVLELGQVEVQDLITFGYCLARAGDFDAARALAGDLPHLLVGLDDAQREALSDFALPLYQYAALAFAVGREAEAEAIVDLLLPHEPFGRRILGLSPPIEDGVERPARLEDSVVADFILQKIADSAAGHFAPPGSGRSRAAYEHDFARYRGQRVLIIHCQHYYPNPMSEPHPLVEYLLDTAADVGLQPRVILSDIACFVSETVDPSRTTETLNEITQTVEDFLPDVIVFHNLGCNGGGTFTDSIRDLRARHGFRLVGVYHDIWAANIREPIRQVSDILDAVWFFDPTATSPEMHSVPRGIGTVPPIPEAPFAAAQTRMARTIGLGFMGTMNCSNFIRAIWIQEMRRRGADIDVVTGFPNNTRYRGVAGFADYLASCNVSLCICGRNTKEDALPGRVWEGILGQSVLLTDDSRHLRYLLTPFAHYVPFRTVDELVFYAGFLARRGDIRDAIACHALDFMRETYPPVRAWHDVMATADGTLNAFGSQMS